MRRIPGADTTTEGRPKRPCLESKQLLIQHTAQKFISAHTFSMRAAAQSALLGAAVPRLPPGEFCSAGHWGGRKLLGDSVARCKLRPLPPGGIQSPFDSCGGGLDPAPSSGGAASPAPSLFLAPSLFARENIHAGGTRHPTAAS